MSFNFNLKEEKYIELLKNKGLKIDPPDEMKISNILFKENISILNVYKFIFIDKTSNKFFKDIDFWSIYSLYNFDKSLRCIYFKYILKVEHQIKAVISNTFISLYGDSDYFNIKNFNIYNINGSLNLDKTKDVLNLVSKLENTLSTKLDKTELISGSIIKLGYVPFDIFVNYLTMGEISTFYSLMKQKDQILVSKIFGILYDDLAFYLKNLTVARNLCAHDEKFFDFKYKKSIKKERIGNSNVFSNFNDNDNFSIAIIISLILGKEETNEFIYQLELEFNKLEEKMPLSVAEIIKNKIGFYDDWKNINLL